MASELEGASALELLRRENELLKQTINDASVSIEDLEQQLISAGVELPAPPALLDAQVSEGVAAGGGAHRGGLLAGGARWSAGAAGGGSAVVCRRGWRRRALAPGAPPAPAGSCLRGGATAGSTACVWRRPSPGARPRPRPAEHRGRHLGGGAGRGGGGVRGLLDPLGGGARGLRVHRGVRGARPPRLLGLLSLRLRCTARLPAPATAPAALVLAWRHLHAARRRHTRLTPARSHTPAPCAPAPPAPPRPRRYGSMSPIPGHDGTDCFRWDNTLWSAAEHFK
jgi:hypothetical protein